MVQEQLLHLAGLRPLQAPGSAGDDLRLIERDRPGLHRLLGGRQPGQPAGRGRHRGRVPPTQAAPGPQERRRGLVPRLSRASRGVQGAGQAGQLTLCLADEHGQIRDLAHQRGRIQRGGINAGQLGQRRIPGRLLW